MKILIIDNHTVHISKIISLLDCSTDVVEFEEISSINLDDFDGIILSGGSKYALVKEPQRYLSEVNLIKRYSKPILGICMGFEILCYTYHEKVEYLGFRELGALKISIIKKDTILNNIAFDFFAYECHRWKISSVKNLIGLAKSHEGIEVVKHVKLPHYGVQFHPEVLLKNENNQKIFINFLEIVRNHK